MKREVLLVVIKDSIFRNTRPTFNLLEILNSYDSCLPLII
jgi:hypothetical protein